MRYSVKTGANRLRNEKRPKDPGAMSETRLSDSRDDEIAEAAEIIEGPLFRPAFRRTKQLMHKAMSGIDICRMMRQRLKAAGLPGQFSPHSSRVATVTDLLEQNVSLED